MKKENKFQQDDVISKIKEMVPGCIVMKNDPTYIQGIPDITVIKGARCALLEVKRSANASHRPNQDYYVKLIRNQGGYASFVYPENVDTVLNETKRFLEQE
mgnify:FL=1